MTSNKMNTEKLTIEQIIKMCLGHAKAAETNLQRAAVHCRNAQKNYDEAAKKLNALNK